MSALVVPRSRSLPLAGVAGEGFLQVQPADLGFRVPDTLPLLRRRRRLARLSLRVLRFLNPIPQGRLLQPLYRFRTRCGVL